MKSQQEIEKLKNEWKSDPCWDIEHTEGFEEHYEELLNFSKQCHAEWEAQNNARMQKRCEELGIPGNFKLLNYIEGLEWRLEKINNDLDKIMNP